MKQFIIPSYTFTPGASGVGTVNLSGISGFDVKYLAAIINQTRGVIIYSTADTTKRFTNVTGTTITLFADTTGQNAADVLQVIYEDTTLNPLTNAQLRAAAVPVSGTVTANTGLTQPLTDAQLRATAVPVSGTFFQATQPVSAASLPLPSGASTSALQSTANSSLSSIDGKIPAPVSSRIPVDGSGVTQPVSGTVAVTGVSTAANQTTGNASLASIDGKLSSLGQKVMASSAPVVIASDQSAIPITGSITASNPSVSATGAVVPAQGTMVAGTDGTNLRALRTDANGELQVDVLSSALPSGAATSANQSTGNSSLASIDGKIPAPISSRIPVDGSGVTQPVSGTFWQATQPVSAASLPLPSGAATSALQTTGNTSLSSIDGKLGSLGQKLMAGSVPVVIASDQSAIPITGSITATNPSVSATGSAVPASGTLIAGTDGTNLRGISVDASGQPQTVVTSCALPPDAATETTATNILAAVSSINLKSTTLVGGRIPVTFDGVAQPISASSLPLPSGAATSSNQITTNSNLVSIDGRLASIDGKIPATSTRVVDNETAGLPVRAIGQEIWNVSFSEVGASVISSQFQAPTIGTGVSYNQGSGALNIVAGTTTNAEFFTRSTTAWRGAMRLKFSIVASQRIANNNLAVMLADLIGEGLSVTINSATSITVSQSGHAFTSTSVGQFVHIGRIVGAAGVPGRYAIASVVAGVSYNLTVAGWPASGSCTATIFGHSYVRNLVTGTTATAINVDAQRRGWAQGDTAATINTTASPGAIITCELTGREVFWADQLRASTTTPAVVVRANRVENIPDDNLDLYLFVWNFNGTTAPASSTTWTISFCSIEKFANMPVYIQGNRAQGAMNPLPVTHVGTATVSGTVTSNIGTGTLAAVTSANLGFPGIITDISSSVLSSTTTTSAFTPTFGTCYSVNIPVTANAGTTPTLDVSIEESDDSGTNWFKVYDFPRITNNGMYRSPIMRLTGNRVRYVQTLSGGGTPSFTRSINRLQISSNNEAVRQLIDRTISLVTLNSTTPSIDTRDCGNRAQLVINVGAITTTAPAIQMEGSDDNGVSWYSIGTPLTAVANATVQVTVTDINAALMRARVSTAGSGVTSGYVMIKAHD